ncbi:MAG TPA: alpha/beta fold hydrolase [Bacteroidia bacterium]|nr:alpha/beta fold hydrolase [Bacteroidia bacterium]HRS58860.1 alpha/beta fold hydrolase [Bacteroidia bacterium]HRU69324.1 alpha/beta fold hydrolase [Bacteroidia bacterium]
MKKLFLFYAVMPGLIFGQDISGTWTGTLEVMGSSLRIVFNISSENGQLKSTMDSPDQGAFGIPMDNTVFNGTMLKITALQIMGEYEGVISDSFNSFSGTWKQSGMKFPLNLKKTNESVTLQRPQHPQPPFPYEMKEVTFRNEKENITLCGTFTYPSQKEAFPAVVLISGSGKQNRDEEILGHKPFLVIADYLTRNGIGVLRFDDRGEGCSEGDFSTATSQNFAQDVQAAVDFLKSQPAVIKDRIGLIGHSEGGLIAPMVAAADTSIYFIVLLAGPGTSGKEILIDQNELILKSYAVPDEEIRKKQALNMDLYEMVINAKNIEKTKEKIEKRIFRQLKKENSANLSDDILKKQAASQAEVLCSPWFRYFLTYQPATALSKVKCFVLALNGSLDLQVPADKNLSAIEKILKESGNQKYTIKKFEGLNHLFQHATTGSPAEYVKIEETFSPEVLEFMKDWMMSILK